MTPTTTPRTTSGVPVVAPAPAGLVGTVRDRAPRVLVLGDALLDGWVSGPVRRIGRDAPVPVVEPDSASTAPGGAANVAANLAALGADVTLVAVFGDDADGRSLRAALLDLGVGLDRSVVELGRATSAKHRVLAAGQPVARYDTGPDGPPRRSTDLAVADALSEAVAAGVDAVVVADYGLGTPGPRARRRLERLRSRLPLLVVDAHDPGRWACLHPDVVTPSAAEAAALLGEAPPTGDRAAWGVERAAALHAATGAAEVLLTLDVDGAVRLPVSGEPGRRPAERPAVESMACGAGDTFTAAWTAVRCAGAGADAALACAQSAADVVVARPGTVVCSADALTARLAAGDRGTVLEHRDLLRALDEHRRAGHRIVFTNGCFDVLHRGHVAYLRQARALGDVLVVALNADESVARLKGPERPVNPLVDRAGVVGAVDAVDLVTAFDADTPVDLIAQVRPDVYAKGGDYTAQMLPETPVVERLGGEVHVLSYLSDHSTTAIVARIRADTAT
ncbi:D-glycero-beta-D-manno-heptose 1-phosphate adenylyltransferase [Pseudonocardia oceani]|uniref:D-glycero-beta-D-manno-heptose 1-phosphate adenylyltransferase n=4 Tax=Pseudonocardia oceani TaxID=2792013 RepID=A0ABS6UHY2_9PSEU|nr:D-glycero-beta-D-manno-heptose 1-phosphate adenylyltransferase [Pseudonocardia oceani]MBW0131828.1 D-glycero-beta-D-manno-heptose 1-phosphate adenylyltransferase [Pseudonocardia oceani]